LPPTDELAAVIESVVRECVADLSQNSLPEFDGLPIWDTPEVGFADGRDPLFTRYKSLIGTFHLTPEEALEAAGREESGIRTRALTVISWVLPFTERIRRSNAIATDGPSRLWAHARTYGEQFNNFVRRRVVDELRERGFAAACPPLSPEFDCVEAPGVGLASIWSERHIAYAAGLGTFGHHRAFISRLGSAIRLGSAVTDAPIPPTPRTYSAHLENCLLAKRGRCLVCADRCPAGAISENGHDKEVCRDYYYRHIVPTRSGSSGVERMGCGLCTTGVPCEFEIPN